MLLFSAKLPSHSVRKSGLTIRVTPLSYMNYHYFVFHHCIFLIVSFIILLFTCFICGSYAAALKLLSISPKLLFPVEKRNL